MKAALTSLFLVAVQCSPNPNPFGYKGKDTRSGEVRYMYVDTETMRRSSRLESYTPIDLIVRKCGVRLSYKSTDTQSI